MKTVENRRLIQLKIIEKQKEIIKNNIEDITTITVTQNYLPELKRHVQRLIENIQELECLQEQDEILYDILNNKYILE